MAMAMPVAAAMEGSAHSGHLSALLLLPLCGQRFCLLSGFVSSNQHNSSTVDTVHQRRLRGN